MDEQFLKRNLSDYLSSTEASKQFGVTNDYIARLCRQGKLEGILEGNGWLVRKSSLEQFFVSGRNLPTAGDTVISSREAARLYRVTNDYISRLCRQGKLIGTLEGRNWLVSTASLKEFFGEIKSVPAPQEPAAPARAYYIEKMPEPPVPLPPAPAKKIAIRNPRMPSSLAFALAAFVIAFGAYAMVGNSLNKNANLAAVGSGNFLGISSALHGLYDGVHDFFFGAPQLATEPPQSPVTVTPPPAQTAAATSTQTIVQNNTYPIRERTVVETQSGVTSEILQAQLSQLASSLHQEIYNAVHTPPPVITFTGNTIPPSNTANTTSGTLTITDADVPDTITASNYVPLAGGAITGDFSVAGLTTLAYASSTALSITGTGSTTDLIISSLGSLGTTCVQADNTGKLSSTGSACGSGGGGGSFAFTPASFGSTASNATSTLVGFNAGLYALASSTIGDGTQIGGLTVSGGATTTGNTYLGGTLRTGGSAAIGGDLDIGGHQLTFGNWTLNNSNYPGGGGFVYTSGGDLTFGFSSSGFGPSSQASLQIDGAFIQAEGDKTNTYAGPSQFNNAVGVTGLATLSDFTGINATTTNATTTSLAISNISPGNLLKTVAGGSIVAAVAGTDYLTSANVPAFPFTSNSFGSSVANSTSTLIGFTSGMYSLASSTVGSGAAGGGLTISGSATTTGSAYFAGNVGIGTTTPGTLLSIGDTGGINFTLATSTFSTTGGINISSGCFAIANTCLSSSPSLTGSTGQVAYFSDTNSAAGTSSLFISPQGNVGVGTTSVSGAALVVSNALSSLGGLLIQTWTNVTNAFTIKNSSGTTVFNVDNTQASASLGIGTTTPLSTLVAAGNATIGVDYNVAAPLNGLLVEGRVGIGTTTASSVFNVSGSANIGADYGVPAPANGLLVEGVTGIGTTTPWGTLAVDSSIVSSPITTPQLTLKSVAGQSANAFAIYNSAGTVQFSVGATGIVNAVGSITTQGIRSQIAVASGVNAALFLAVGSTATQNQFQSVLPANATGLSLSSLTSTQLGQFSVNGNGNWNIGTTSTTSNIVFSIQAPPTSGNVSGYGAQNALFDVASTTSTTYATSSLFRINATGKVGVGTTSPLAKLSVDTSNLLSGSPSFVVGSTTRTDFIITQTGYVGINSVNPQNFLSISTSTNLGTISLEFNGASAFAGGFNNSDPGSAGQTTFNFLRNNTSVGSINTTNVATAYNTSSDRRVKENIATTSLGLDTLMQLPVRDFDFIKDPAHKLTTGFIAQELYNVFPEAVSTNGDDGTVALSSTSTPWSVDYGRITPLIVKAVQDLNAKVEDLATSTQPAAGSFAQRFFASLTQRLAGWLAESANGIGDIFAQTITITTVNADTVNAKTLCLEDVCVTKSQLQSLLSAQNISEEPPAPEPPADGGEGSSTPEEVTPPDNAPQPEVTVSEGAPPVIDDAH